MRVAVETVRAITMAEIIAILPARTGGTVPALRCMQRSWT